MGREKPREEKSLRRLALCVSLEGWAVFYFDWVERKRGMSKEKIEIEYSRGQIISSDWMYLSTGKRSPKSRLESDCDRPSKPGCFDVNLKVLGSHWVSRLKLCIRK